MNSGDVVVGVFWAIVGSILYCVLRTIWRALPTRRRANAELKASIRDGYPLQHTNPVVTTSPPVAVPRSGIKLLLVNDPLRPIHLTTEEI